MDREDRFARRRAEPTHREADDAAARLAYELATKPPTKTVAAIKAASDVFEANAGEGRQSEAPRRERTQRR